MVWGIYISHTIQRMQSRLAHRISLSHRHLRRYVKCVCYLFQDRNYTFETSSPPTSYFLKKAAGIEKGASKPGKMIYYLSVIGKYKLLGI